MPVFPATANPGTPAFRPVPSATTPASSARTRAAVFGLTTRTPGRKGWGSPPRARVSRSGSRTPSFAIAFTACAICAGVTAIPWPKETVASRMGRQTPAAGTIPRLSPPPPRPVGSPKPKARMYRWSVREPRRRATCRVPMFEERRMTPAKVSGPSGFQSRTVRFPTRTCPPWVSNRSSSWVTPSSSAAAAVTILKTEPGS